jgi:hypothetical protein
VLKCQRHSFRACEHCNILDGRTTA